MNLPETPKSAKSFSTEIRKSEVIRRAGARGGDEGLLRPPGKGLLRGRGLSRLRRCIRRGQGVTGGPGLPVVRRAAQGIPGAGRPAGRRPPLLSAFRERASGSAVPAGGEAASGLGVGTSPTGQRSD